MRKFYDFMAFQLKSAPASFGWFHLSFVAIVIAVTVLFCIYFRDSEDKIFRRVILISWIVMVVFELYKEFFYNFHFVDNEYTYDWYYFPFQLCSTPFYVLPFIAFMKESKLRDYFSSFISTFAFFGGLVVFIYPNDVFVKQLGINFQTMIHHGLQLILGIYIAVYNRKKLNIKYFLKSIPVFLVCLMIAVILNETVHSALIKAGINDSFSMFYISPYVANHLPILSVVYKSVDWIIFFLVYTVGFCVAAILMHYAMVGGIKLANIINDKIKKPASAVQNKTTLTEDKND